MSTEGEEINKITADKPGRQEWGRKLGKMMKERKLKNQQEMEKEQKVEIFLGSLVRLDYCLAASVIIIIGAVSVYYRHKRADIRQPIIEVKNTKPQFSAF